MAALGDKNVCRFDVAVDDTFGVSYVEAVRDLDTEIEDGVHFHRPPADAVLQRDTVQILHHDVGLPVFLPDLVNRANVWVI